MSVKETNFRLVVLGDYSVGKSSLTLQYVKKEFNSNEESTIGAAFLTKSILHNGKFIKLEIWDTAGQERYNSLIPMYYRGAQAALIVYDITCNKSFLRAQDWFYELSEKKAPSFVKILIGNKTDLENREVSYEEGMLFAKKNSMMFFETSAKSGSNVENVFAELIKIVPLLAKDEQVEVVSLNKKGRFNCC